jgi:peroxiredoxin Q/BCP
MFTVGTGSIQYQKVSLTHQNNRITIMNLSLFVVVFLFLACISNANGYKFGLRSLSMVKVGEQAPDFQLSTASGKSFSLSSFKGKKNVVLFFYPADNTPGCTKEACAFERKAPEFLQKNAQIFGISSGSAQDKEKFIRTNKLNSMELLIDAGDKVRNLFQVPRALAGLFPGRVTYVIDKNGKVISIYDDLANAEKHPEKALEALVK